MTSVDVLRGLHVTAAVLLPGNSVVTGSGRRFCTESVKPFPSGR